jgi:DNA-binding response OmpR family regulator
VCVNVVESMAQEKILITEDESRVAQALSRALSLPEGGGYLVEACESGEEALALLAESQFDLLITDLRLPGMTGLDLVSKCREVSPKTSSILITAFGSPQVEDSAFQLGVDAYLPKPFSMRSLVQAVQNTLKQKSLDTAASRLCVFSEEGLRPMQRRMEELREDVGARDVLMFDQAGELLAESGQPNEFDTGAFVTLLGNAMAATNAVSDVLGEREAFDLHFHEAKKYDTYTARVSNQVFLAIVLDKQGNNSRIGMVWLYLRRAITDLRSLLANAKTGNPGTSEQGMHSASKNALEKTLRPQEPFPKRAKPTTNGPVSVLARDALVSSLNDALKTAGLSPIEEPDSDMSARNPNTAITYDQARRIGLLDLDKPAEALP